MNREELAYLREFDQPAPVPMVSINDLTDGSDRTLIWGYSDDLKNQPYQMFHVFVRHRLIGRVVYEHPDVLVSHERRCSFEASQMIPSKRLYPEACDFDFCLLLRTKGLTLPFTTFNANRERKQYYGLVPNDL